MIRAYSSRRLTSEPALDEKAPYVLELCYCPAPEGSQCPAYLPLR
jgi:hypothetical protein